VSVSLSPTALNDTRIPNEDSQVFEFDDANLFSLNRFTGSDRVSEGSRIDYGINLGLFHSTAGKANLFIGQSYQLQPAKGFIVGSGLEDQLSDTVGRFSANYQNLADFTYRFRIDQNSGRFRRHDASLTLNTAPVQWTASYLFLDEQANRALNILNTERREEVSGRASLLLSDAWELSGNITRDINQGSTRYAGLGLSYFLDCIAFNLDIDRDFTTDGQLPRETRVLFRLNFKHLGDNSVDSYLRSRNRLTGRERTFSDFFND
jgi:LPS-assembly protein